MNTKDDAPPVRKWLRAEKDTHTNSDRVFCLKIYEAIINKPIPEAALSLLIEGSVKTAFHLASLYVDKNVPLDLYTIAMVSLLSGTFGVFKKQTVMRELYGKSVSKGALLKTFATSSLAGGSVTCLAEAGLIPKVPETTISAFAIRVLKYG